ncbi:MAG: ATP-binding protein [Planctomycetes bacterium]|nr:ATP-binding protein [Planctomycetota bacterium]
MGPARELASRRFLFELEAQLEQVRGPEKALRLALRRVREFFRAGAACIGTLKPGGGGVEPLHVHPRGAAVDLSRYAGLPRVRPAPSRDALSAPLERRERAWGLIHLEGGEFDLESRNELGRAATALSKAISRMDRVRIAEVRARIDRKILEQLRPKDLFYQILDGLRSLTRYDHSSALLIHRGDRENLELVAEQVAWRKAPSPNIGRTFSLDAPAWAALGSGAILGFDRDGSGWREWNGRACGDLPRALDYNPAGEAPRERCVLCAPFATRTGPLGLLKVASRHPGTLGPFEAELVERFLPQAAVAIQNLERATSFEIGMLEAEKKHAMANLARGVSHDVHNALGAVLPLVQQMRAEAGAGVLDLSVLGRDLEQLEESLQVCRRIFGGMLAFAQGKAALLGRGNVARAVQSTLAILEQGMRRDNIRVERDLVEPLPAVRVSQSDLEQLLLNLSTNAREAMPDGGMLSLRARPVGRDVEIALRDTGAGIAPEHLARVQEPFFTTKRHGSGLGLSVCRSIVRQAEGTLEIESRVGSGTRVLVRLPAAREDDP